MKKGERKLFSGFLATAAIMGNTMVTVPAEVCTNVDRLWVNAYGAIEGAIKLGTQDNINEARVAIRELKRALKDDVKLQNNLIGTLSGMLDPVQHKLFIDFYNILYEGDRVTEKKRLSQAEINKARKFILGFKGAIENEPYVPSWSSALDKFQQKNIENVLKSIKKIKNSYNSDDLKEGEKLILELMTVENNDSIKIIAQDFKIDFLKLQVKVNRIQEFKDNYKRALNLKEDNVTKDHIEIVSDAIKAYNLLSKELQEILNKEKNHLDQLKKATDKLKDTISPTYPSNPTPIENSKDKADEFKKLNFQVLSLNVQSITLQDKLSILKTLNTFNELSLEVKAYLKDEGTLLNKLSVKLNDLVLEEANKFKDKYIGILNTSVENIQISSKIKIIKAIEEYIILPEDVQSLLKEEQVHLFKLKAKLENNKLSSLDVKVNGKYITVNGVATEYNGDGLVLVIKNLKGDTCYFDQLSMGLNGEFSYKFDFTNNLLGNANESGTYKLCMKIQGKEVKEENFKFSVENVIKIEMESYLEKHRDILEFNVSNIGVVNELAVDSALDDYENLSIKAKESLEDKKILFDALKKQIGILRIKADAVSFKEKHSVLLLLKSDELKYKDHNEALTLAMNDYKVLTDESKKLLTEEKKKLDELKEKMAILKIIAEADGFKETHSTVLGLTIKTIELNNEEALIKALVDYEQLSKEAKDLLVNGEKDCLDNLKSQVEKLKLFKELGDLIEETIGVHKEAVEGDYAYKNTYIKGSKAIFKEAIDAAELVFKNKENTKDVVNKAKADLNTAYDKFKNLLIGDLEVPGGDQKTGKVEDNIEITIDLKDGETIVTDSSVLTEGVYEKDKYVYIPVGTIRVEEGKIIVTCTKATVGEYGASFYVKVLNKEGISVKSTSIKIIINEK